MGFQTRVNAQPPPAVAGDFAGTNPRMSVTAPPGGYTAAPDYPLTFGGALTEALVVGRFAWFNYATDDSVVDGQLPAGGLASNYFQPNSIIGFVHREDQTVITKFLSESRLGVQQGFPVTGIVQGDVWADFSPGPDNAGLVVYADPLTGKATAAASGQGVTLTLTASVATTGVMTVTVTSGVIAVGQVVQNAALGLLPGTFIVSQLTGSAGSTGTYQLNQAPAVAVGSGTITSYGKQATRWKLAQPVAGGSSFTGQFIGTMPPSGSPFLPGPVADGILTVTGSVTGQALAAGQLLTGVGLTPAAQILGQNAGGTPGGAGTYNTNVFIVQGSAETMTAAQGTLAKISTWQA